METLLWIILMTLTTMYLLPTTTVAEVSQNNQLGSEVSDLDEISKRYGYIPSRGRKSDEMAKSEEQSDLSSGDRIEISTGDSSKRAFHGARGKKGFLYVPKITSSDETLRSIPLPERLLFPAVMRVYEDVDPITGQRVPIVEKDDGEDAYQVPAQFAPRFQNRPLYSRLVPGSVWRGNSWSASPVIRDDESVGKRMVYYTSRG